MYHVAKHADDGTEMEYWFVQDDSTAGYAAEGEAFDNEADCLKEVDRLNRETDNVRINWDAID
jgi:hypothetical protein